MTETHRQKLLQESERFRQEAEYRRNDRRPKWSGSPMPSKPKRPTGTLANFTFESDKQ